MKRSKQICTVTFQAYIPVYATISRAKMYLRVTVKVRIRVGLLLGLGLELGQQPRNKLFNV